MAEPVNAFRNIINNEVETFIVTSKGFESTVMDKLASLVKGAFEAELLFIRDGIRRPDPLDIDKYTELMKPVSTKVVEIDKFSKSNWGEKDYINHLTTVTNAITALNWIGLKKTPVQFIKDMKESGDYYGNRVLTANRGSQLHMNWINSWNAVMTALENYVKQYHLNGFTWNLKIEEALPDLPLPPPPPPAPPAFQMLPSELTYPPPADAPAANRAALMRELNQGVDIQRVLRPVKGAVNVDDPAQMPHGPMPVRGLPPPPPPPHQVPSDVFTLEGRKWRIEYQYEAQLRVEPQNKSELLAVYRCRCTQIDCVAKLNAVTIDNCQRCRIGLNDIIASVEVIGCTRLEIHCRGTCPNISLDNCDSVQIFLYDDSDHCEVVSAKSTSTNICRMTADGDYVEYPVPEQFRSQLINGKLMNTVVEHHM